MRSRKPQDRQHNGQKEQKNKRTKGQTMIYKTSYGKLKTHQQKLHYKPVVNQRSQNYIWAWWS